MNKLYTYYPITSTGTGVTPPPTGVVLSLNGLTGAVILAAGTDISITPTGNTLTIASTGSSGITALTGDGTATGPGSAALTLATVNSNVGSFGTASSSSTFAVNAKGLITAASNTAIQIAESQVTNLVSDLAGKQATGNYITALTGDVTAAGPGSAAATIANLAVTNAKIANATIDLTTKVTGALPIANGGTGQITKAAAFDALSPMTTGGDIIYGGASGTGTRLANGTSGQALISAGTTLAPVWTTLNIVNSEVTIVIDGSGSVITTGPKQVYLRIPYNCTITGWDIVSGTAGSIVFDIWVDTYANFPPTVADTITGSAKPTLTASTKATSTTLTGWTTSLVAGSYIEINVDSASTVTKVILTLVVSK